MTRILNELEVRELINNEDRGFIGCQINPMDFAEFEWFEREDGLFESGDWIEGEGAPELIVDRYGIMQRFEGYYFKVV